MSQRGTGLVKCRFENLSITQKKSLGIFRPLRRKALKIFRPQRRKAWAISSLDLPSLLRCSLASVWTKGKLAALTKKHTKTKRKTKTFTLLTFRILPICPNSATQQTQSMAPFNFFLIFFPVADLLVGFIYWLSFPQFFSIWTNRLASLELLNNTTFPRRRKTFQVKIIRSANEAQSQRPLMWSKIISMQCMITCSLPPPPKCSSTAKAIIAVHPRFLH